MLGFRALDFALILFIGSKKSQQNDETTNFLCLLVACKLELSVTISN